MIQGVFLSSGGIGISGLTWSLVGIELISKALEEGLVLVM